MTWVSIERGICQWVCFISVILKGLNYCVEAYEPVDYCIFLCKWLWSTVSIKQEMLEEVQNTVQ
jgi:hypothetical protein